MLPLFVRYKTRTENRYVYDCCTGEILRVGYAVYQILEDYYVLTSDEIYEKHIALGKEIVREALTQLGKAQENGVLRGHAPELSAEVESLYCEKEPEPLREFLQKRRRLLTLELTHQCNLACEYCCFGKHYDQTRQPSATAMSLDTAKHAVAHFISHKPMNGAIGFYGGEPLMQFGLIKDVVAFAEEQAEQLGIEMRFALTTNGTLLSEEKIHYLVAHKFSVMISLDGNKEAHDRYRIFKNGKHPERRRGSFDVVIRNMKRFVELYPDYMHRGIVLTLTATSDLSDIEKFVQQWKPLFPAFVSNVVTSVSSHLEKKNRGCSIETGSFHNSECGDGFCGRKNLKDEVPDEIPEFDNWSKGKRNSLRLGVDRFVSELCQTDSNRAARTVCESCPTSRNLFDNLARSVHRRRILSKGEPKPRIVRMSCFPGATRTYCSSQGVLFPCEKAEFSKLFEIGDAAGDVDVDKVCDLNEMIRLGCDCGNCTVNKFCQLCPAQVTESKESPGHPDYFALQKTCQQMASESRFAARLREYTEIMETNSEILDWLYEGLVELEEDWLNNVRVSIVKQEDVELGVEELEEFL